MARPKREVPWLDRRGGVYYAFWYDAEAGETKRQSLRTKDGSEAQDRFAAFLTEGTAKPRRDAVVTVAQALDDYRREHVAERCADPGRQEDAIAHLKAFFADCPLDRVTIQMSRAYAEARRSGAIGGGRRRFIREGGDKALVRGSDSTIRRELTVLGAASKHAKKWKRTTVDVSLELPPERRLGPDDEAPYFTREEFEKLRKAAAAAASAEEFDEMERAMKPRRAGVRFVEKFTYRELAAFIDLAYYTGARRRSIEDLTLTQVRWGQGQIVLQAAGKRGTKKRQPIVPILPEMVDTLKTLTLGAASRGGHGVRLFRSADLYRPFRLLCEAAGLGGRDHPHLLRHTRATHLLQGGVPIYDVAKLLGDTIATVDRVYGHHSQHRLAEMLTGK